MKNKKLKDIINEVTLECHLDMFFYQLLAVIIQELKEENNSFEFTSSNINLVSKKFVSIVQVLLYVEFQVKINEHDITQQEEEYVRTNYNGYYNYIHLISLDIMKAANYKYDVYKNFKKDVYIFTQYCGVHAFNKILNRLENDNTTEFFKHSFVSDRRDTKLLIYITIFGLFKSETLFKAFRENKFNELLKDYLNKFQLFIVSESETTINFESDFVIGLNYPELKRTLLDDFFVTFNSNQTKITNGIFWRYQKKTREDYSSCELAPNLKPIVSFLDNADRTLIKQCQIYLEYIKY